MFPPLLLALVALQSVVAWSSPWQQELDLGGDNRDTQLNYRSLRNNGAGVDIQVRARVGADYRVASIANANAAPVFKPADGLHGDATAVAGGWLERVDGNFGAPILPSDCSLALRNTEGRITGKLPHIDLGDCWAMLFDAKGAVVIGQGPVLALTPQVQERWRVDSLHALGNVDPVRAADGSIWIAAYTGSGPVLVRLADADGSERARSAPLAAGAYEVRGLHPTAQGGVQAWLQLRASSGLAGPAVLIEVDSAGLRTRERVVVPLGNRGTDLTQGPGGSAACWFEQAAAGGFDLHVAVLDAQLNIRWTRRLLTATNTGLCQMRISLAGRSAVQFGDGSDHRLLRFGVAGELIEQLNDDDFVPFLGPFLFSDDESLWLALNADSSTSGPVRLLRFAADAPGVARDIELVMPGQIALSVTMSPSDGSGRGAEILTMPGLGSQPYTAFHADAQGVRARLMPVGAEARLLVEYPGGWLFWQPGELVALDHDEHVRWRRGLDEATFAVRGACAADGRCALALYSHEFGTQIVLVDSAGNPLMHQPVPEAPGLTLFHHDTRQDRLYLQTRSQQGAATLDEITSTGLLRCASTASFNSSVLRIAPFGQLLGRPNVGELRSFGISGENWRFDARTGHDIVASLIGDAWEFPSLSTTPSVQIAPLDGAGQRRWTLTADRWLPSALYDPLGIPPGESRMAAVGHPEHHSWLAGATSDPAGIERYEVQTVDGAGTRKRTFTLPQATGPVRALSGADGDEALLVAYPIRSGTSGPRLRISRLETGLFQDGLED